MAKKRERATEVEFLRWFYSNCDFGPAHSDVMDHYQHQFMEETGKNLPDERGYNIAMDGETNLDE